MIRDPGLGLGLVDGGEIVCQQFVNNFCKKISYKNCYESPASLVMNNGSSSVDRGP